MSWAAVVSGKARDLRTPPVSLPASHPVTLIHTPSLSTPDPVSSPPKTPCLLDLPSHPSSIPLTSPSPLPSIVQDPPHGTIVDTVHHIQCSPPPPTLTSPLLTPQNNLSSPSMWDDPRVVAIYRLWTHHISNFMAQPVPFFHFFVVSVQFRLSVFEAGLTFHPDTDPANPVLINLNSARFGMAERISALSPPAGLEARVTASPLSSVSTPHQTHPLSPLSEPSQPSHPVPPLHNPAFFTSNANSLYNAVKAANAAVPNEKPLVPIVPYPSPMLHMDPNSEFHFFDSIPLSEDNLLRQFSEGVRIDVSDSDSERYSEADIATANATKSKKSFKENSQTILYAQRRHSGRSKVVSRVLDIRVPSHPICKHLSDKAKVEFIEQINEIFPSITPPPEFADIRAGLLEYLRDIITHNWEGANIDIYGSTGNGLDLRSADIDMSLYMPKDLAMAHSPEKGKSGAPVILAELASIMEQKNFVILRKILEARVPVIKMQDPISKVQVDVCMNNILAVRNTELLKAYVDLDERFRYVCILVKLWAKRRKLNEAYSGTLSSYAYTLLVIHYFQTLKQPVLPCLQQMVNGKVVPPSNLPTEMTDNGNNKLYNTYFDRSVKPATYKCKNTSPVHELLLGFFRYYAYAFKYRTDLVSIRLGVRTRRSARKWDEQTVYGEWERKQAEYRSAVDAAQAALEARRKADAEERRRTKCANGTESKDTKEVTGSQVKRERIQYPRRPRLGSKHLFCIEDPFDIDHDLSRGMEKAAVTVIRQEMMRAYEMIAESGDFEFVCEEFG